MHELCAAAEEYLKWIYRIQQINQEVRSIDLAVYMGYSRASICTGIQKLEKRRLLHKDERGILHLSEEGLQIAKQFNERHQILTEILVEMGVSEEVAVADACKLEHVLSKESWSCLKKYFLERRMIHG